MTSQIGARSARRRLLLTATRWFPVGLTIGLVTLLALERGLTLPQVTTALAAQGLVILVLELPTGGLADALGRRPVLLAAGLVAVASGTLLLVADGFWAFTAAWALQGVFRALDSGPLEAWYVDTAQADGPDTPIERTLATAGTVLGVAIAAGALVAGGLVAWHPWSSVSALVLPLALAVALTVAHLVGVALLVVEPPRAEHGLRPALRHVAQTARVVRTGVGLLRADRILRGLVVVEVFWAVGMVAFETLLPIRLAEVLAEPPRRAPCSGRPRPSPGGCSPWAPAWSERPAGGWGWPRRRSPPACSTGPSSWRWGWPRDRWGC